MINNKTNKRGQTMKNTIIERALYTAINSSVDMISKLDRQIKNVSVVDFPNEVEYLNTLKTTRECYKIDLADFKCLINKMQEDK